MDNKVIEDNKKKIGKNYFYNLLYQLFLIIVPLITAPYVSRVLLPEGVGQYTFSFTITSILTVFASLGFGYYAQREIAKHQGDLEKQSIVFWEIILCRLLPVFITLVSNIICCSLNVYRDYTVLMWILNLNIISVAFDINFIFQGNEKFKSIVIRNLIIKLATVFSIFIFVKHENGVWTYTLINSISVLVSALSMWLPVRKCITKINSRCLRPLKHIKGSFVLFLPTVALSMYTLLDKTFLGLLITDVQTDGDAIVKVSDLEVGYYEQAEKIVKTALAVVTSIGVVMIPRNSNEFAQGNIEGLRNNIYKTSQIVFLIGMPMIFGLIGVADIFVPQFFGTKFSYCSLLIKIMSPLIIIIGLSNIFGLQFLIPTGRDKKFTIALIIGAAVNITLNIVLILFLKSAGAAIATVIAELVITITMAVMIRKDINFLKILISSWKSILCSLIMFVPVYISSILLPYHIAITIGIIAIGIVIYFLLLIALKEEIVVGFIKNKLLKKK